MIEYDKTIVDAIKTSYTAMFGFYKTESGEVIMFHDGKPYKMD